jgi:signal recognition particle GTPase
MLHYPAGAVEQLKTHCNRLKMPLYERGYEKDPAKVGHDMGMESCTLPYRLWARGNLF